MGPSVRFWWYRSLETGVPHDVRHASRQRREPTTTRLPRQEHGDVMLVAGDWVEVKPASEILRTLDSAGSFEGLPVMPEMLPFCGQRFRVAMRADRACVYPPQFPFRRLENCVVLQGLRCDGSSHATV